ncbi:MAG: MazG nucleotide pyrophosphohydrolase domain-containing protein [Planctomycetota bacterium]
MSDSTEKPDGSEPLTIAAFQRYIHERYYETDAARGTPGTFMWLVEEVGELATALHKSAGEGGDTSGDDDPAGEFADVLAWLCTLANINGVDLEKAIREKYLDGDGPAGTK